MLGYPGHTGAFDLHSHPVYGGAGSDVEGHVVGVAPCEVGRKLGETDLADVVAIGAVHKDAAGTGAVGAAFHVDLYSVGDAGLAVLGELGEDAAVGEGAVGLYVVGADVFVVAGGW